MKKLFCLVLTLCLLMTTCAAFAETVDYKADYAAKISKLADSMRAYPRKPSYSVSFLQRIFLLSSPHTIILDISD